MIKKYLVILVVIFLIPACHGISNKVYKDYSVDKLTLEIDPLYKSLVKELKDKKADRPSLVKEACFLSYSVDSNNEINCRKQRNQAIAMLIFSSEKLCVDHRKTIYGNEAAWNIVSGTFTNLFAGAASVTGGQSAKSLLSALALFSNSERSLVNESVYKTALIQAVDSKIVQVREEKAQTIYEKYHLDNIEYPLSVALYDVINFHYSCSFMSGLRLALEEGTQERPKQKIMRLKNSLKSIEVEMNSIPSERSPAKEVQYQSLVNRYESIVEALQALEIQ